MPVFDANRLSGYCIPDGYHVRCLNNPFRTVTFKYVLTSLIIVIIMIIITIIMMMMMIIIMVIIMMMMMMMIIIIIIVMIIIIMIIIFYEVLHSQIQDLIFAMALRNLLISLCQEYSLEYIDGD